MKARRALCLLALLPGLLRGQAKEDEEANRITLGELQLPPKIQQGAAFVAQIPVQAQWKTPYNPSKFRVVARITSPDGEQIEMPCYYMEGYEIAVQRTEDVCANVRQVRFEFDPRDWPDGEAVELYVDALELVHSPTGKRVVLDKADAVEAWSGVSLQHELSTEVKAEGNGSIRAALTTGEAPGEAPPALVLNVARNDWTGLDTLEFRVLLKTRVGDSKLRVTLDAGDKGKSTEVFSAACWSYATGEWSQIRMRLPTRKRASEWKRQGDKQWRLRFCPLKAGVYRLHAFAENQTNWAKTPEVEFEAAAGNDRVIVRPGLQHGDYFEFASGGPFFPVGMNVCWGDPVQMVTYLERLAANGGNLVRFWMCPWNFPLEWGKAGEYDQKAAAQLDYVFENCERLGLKVLLCLDYHGALKADESWSRHPYNAENGGPCGSSDAFFSDSKALRLYQNRLLYLIARYGGSPSLFAWELFNEVGLTDAYRSHKRRIHAWHETMATCLKRNDPYQHAVTTSVAGEDQWESPLWRVENLDFVQAHQYGGWRSFGLEAARTVERLAKYRRPVLLSEFGLREERARNFDPSGRALHSALWAATVSGAAGTPMPWWWDTYVDAFDLYGQFSSVARFVDDVDFPREGFRPISQYSLEFSGQTNAYGAVIIQPDQTSFAAAPFNQPQTYRVLRDGTVEGPFLRAETIHGTKANPHLHNSQTFEVDYPVDGTFGVAVTEVSNYQSSELNITVDAELALREEFPDDDPASGAQYRYSKVYRVPVKAGTHTVTVDNRGDDWIKVAYLLENYRGIGPKALTVLGMAGTDTAMVWVAAGETVHYAWKLGVKPTPVGGAILRIDDLPAEQWKVLIWDTSAGKVISESVIRRRPARIALPPVASDVAVKLRRIRSLSETSAGNPPGWRTARSTD